MLCRWRAQTGTVSQVHVRNFEDENASSPRVTTGKLPWACFLMCKTGIEIVTPNGGSENGGNYSKASDPVPATY